MLQMTLLTSVGDVTELQCCNYADWVFAAYLENNVKPNVTFFSHNLVCAHDLENCYYIWLAEIVTTCFTHGLGMHRCLVLSLISPSGSHLNGIHMQL